MEGGGTVVFSFARAQAKTDALAVRFLANCGHLPAHLGMVCEDARFSILQTN